MSTETSTSPIRWFFGIFVALAVFGVVGIYSSNMANHTTGYDEDQAQARYAKLAKLQAADEKTLTTADWVDKDKGTVRIPIDEAMTEEVAALKTKPMQAGIAIPGAVAPAMNTLPATNAPTNNASAPATSATPNPPSGKAPTAKAPAKPASPTAPPAPAQKS